MHEHDDSVDHGTGNKIVSFNWMQPRHGGFLVLDESGAPIKAFSSYFEMEHDFNMQMRQEAGIVAPDAERMPNFVSDQNPKATALTDEVRTQPPRAIRGSWNLGNSIVNLAARAAR